MNKVSTWGTRDETRIGVTPAAYRGWMKLAVALIFDALRSRDHQWLSSAQGELCMEAMGYTPTQIESLRETFRQGRRSRTAKKNLKYFYRGRMMGAWQISEETGIPDSTIRARLNRGLTIEEAVRETVEEDWG